MIFLRSISEVISRHFLCESAEFIATKEAISQLSPISIFEFFEFI